MKTTMKTYTINQLMGEAYREAICNVMWELNNTFGNNLFFGRDDAKVDMLAEKLGIRFNENGDIIR